MVAALAMKFRIYGGHLANETINLVFCSAVRPAFELPIVTYVSSDSCIHGNRACVGSTRTVGSHASN